KAGRRSGVPSWTRPANSWNSAKREARRPPWISGAEKLLIRTGWLVHRDCMRQLERHRRLRRNLDFLVAGYPRARGAGASTDQAADQRALAAARQAADQETGAGSASRHHSRALAFTLYDPGIGECLDRHRRSADVDGGQGDRQDTLTFEFARRFDIDNPSAHARTGWDRYHSADRNRARQRTCEGVAWVRGFRCDAISHSNHDVGPSRNHQWRRRGRRLRGLCALLRGRRWLPLRVLLRGRHLASHWLAARRLAGGRRLRLVRRGSVARRHCRVLRLIFLATGREAHGENCDEQERE